MRPAEWNPDAALQRMQSQIASTQTTLDNLNKDYHSVKNSNAPDKQEQLKKIINDIQKMDDHLLALVKRSSILNQQINN